MFTLLLLGAMLPLSGVQAQTPTVEQWGVYEVVLSGPAEGNPFLDVSLGATFTCRNREVKVTGFYDGDSTYRIRFMPDSECDWTYRTSSNRAALDGKTGQVRAVKPSAGNHGPVVVRNGYHFGYADGTPYYPIGTTCYAWTHQGDKLEQQTLKTLEQSPFNKMRMCVFPKSYAFNTNEPPYYPFERDSAGHNDFTRFNPKFFEHFEQRVRQLGELGIEADLILLHPYDRWGLQEHARRGRRPLSALRRRAALRLPQRLVVARQRVGFHARKEASPTGTASSASSPKATPITTCAPSTTAPSSTTTRSPGSPTPPSSTPTSSASPPGATPTKSRSFSTKSSTKATSRIAGATSRLRSWYGASGSAASPAPMSATAKLTLIRKTSSGGRKAARSTARARNASRSCAKSSSSSPPKASRPSPTSIPPAACPANSTSITSTRTSPRAGNSTCPKAPTRPS